MNGTSSAAFEVMALLALVQHSLAADGDAARGQRVFQAGAPCHSLESNRNMTGPGLAGVWNRKAGMLSSFDRLR